MVTDLREFCRLFYFATAIPLAVIAPDGSPLYAFPSILIDPALFTRNPTWFLRFSGERSPDYFISPSFSYYGYVDCGDSFLVIGPIFSTPMSDFTLNSFMTEWAISCPHREEVSQFLMGLPVVAFYRFLQVLAYLAFCVNEQRVDVDSHFKINNTDQMDVLTRAHTSRSYESKEEGQFHNTWHFEQKMMHCIEEGASDKLEKLLRDAVALTPGKLADNALRQEKNLLITAIALAARSAIRGGLDTEQAYQLADVYLLEGERSQSIHHLANLQYTMLMDFVDRVAQAKVPAGLSREVFDAVQHIHQHINEPIQVPDVTRAIGRSRSWLSARFKDELGMDISEYIMQCRLEQAQKLLAHSDMSLSEISAYLCFSSQSYFQNVFKKKFGMTPRQYRIEYRKA